MFSPLSNSRRMVTSSSGNVNLSTKGIAVLSSRLNLSYIIHDCFLEWRCSLPFQIRGEWPPPLQERKGCPPPSQRHGSGIKEVKSIVYYRRFFSDEKMFSPLSNRREVVTSSSGRRGTSTSFPKAKQYYQTDWISYVLSMILFWTEMVSPFQIAGEG